MSIHLFSKEAALSINVIVALTTVQKYLNLYAWNLQTESDKLLMIEAEKATCQDLDSKYVVQSDPLEMD